MEAFFIYLVQSAVCVFLYESFYRLFLRGESFHCLNRMVLLGSLFCALLLPLVDISLGISEHPTVFSESLSELVALQESVVTVVADSRSVSGSFSWQMIFCTVYFSGVILLLLKNLLVFGYLSSLLGKCRKERAADGVVFYRYPGQIGPFSWLGRVILSESDNGLLADCVLAHERAHTVLGHAYDLVLAELFLCFQWFNPAAWWLKRDLRMVHEFEADRYVLASGFDAQTYQLLLIQKTVGPKIYGLTHSFNQSLLKQRITMMLKGKSKIWKSMKGLYVLPLALCMLMLFSFKVEQKGFQALEMVVPMRVFEKNKMVQPAESDQIRKNENEVEQSVLPKTKSKPRLKSESNLKTKSDRDTVFNVTRRLQILPSFPGGDSALINYVARHIVYPQEAVAQKIEGRVLVHFVVTCSGALEQIEIKNSIHPLLDAEALRVVREMPNWLPGKLNNGKLVHVRMGLPIRFVLPQSVEEEKEEVMKNV